MEYTRNKSFIFLAVYNVLFLQTGMACQIEEELAFEIHTTGRIPCRHNIPPDLIDFVRWTKSGNDVCYKNGVDYLVQWNGDRMIQDPNYGIDTDFSLVIPDVTTTVNGIYRCFVVPKDATAISKHDTRLTVYKYPDNPPSITYKILGGNQIEINCTHGPVFPLFYPSFPFPNHNNRTIPNKDGTYMVSINAVQQFSGSVITLYCSHSYLDQQRSSFLYVHRSDSKQVDYTTHPPESNTTTVISSSIHTENTPEQCHSGNVALIVISLCLVIVLILNVAGIGCLYCCYKRTKQSLPHRLEIGEHIMHVQQRVHLNAFGDEPEKEGGQNEFPVELMEQDRLIHMGMKKEERRLIALLMQALQKTDTNQQMEPSSKVKANSIES